MNFAIFGAISTALAMDAGISAIFRTGNATAAAFTRVQKHDVVSPSPKHFSRSVTPIKSRMTWPHEARSSCWSSELRVSWPAFFCAVRRLAASIARSVASAAAAVGSA
jgi:hypothetical protein